MAEEQLKTLNELSYLKKGRPRPDTPQTNLYEIIQVGEYNNICYPEQLRQELGIKRIKHLMKNKSKHSHLYTEEFIDCEICSNIAQIEILKEIFNISKEDLK